MTVFNSFERLFSCPITQLLMEDPVVIKTCGHRFEAKALQTWMKDKSNCPDCRQPVPGKNLVVPDRVVRDAIQYVTAAGLLSADSAKPISLRNKDAEQIVREAVKAFEQVRPQQLDFNDHLEEARRKFYEAMQKAKVVAAAIKDVSSGPDCCGFPFAARGE